MSVLSPRTENLDDNPVQQSADKSCHADSVVYDAQNISMKTFLKELRQFLKNTGYGKSHQSSRKQETKSGLVAVQMCQCLFCPKVFGHSKFLLKHAIKRHPEELNQLKLSSCVKDPCNMKVDKSPTEEKFEKELKDLKDMFSLRWSEISKSIESIKTQNITSLTKEFVHHSEAHRSMRRNKEKNREDKSCECSEMKELFTKFEKKFEGMMNVLQTFENKIVLNEKGIESFSSKYSEIRNAINVHEEKLSDIKKSVEKVISNEKNMLDKVSNLDQHLATLEKVHKVDMQQLQAKIKEYQVNSMSKHDIKELVEQNLKSYMLDKPTFTGSNTKCKSPSSSDSDTSQTSDEEEINIEHLKENTFSVDKKAILSYLDDIIQAKFNDLGIKPDTSKLSDEAYDKLYRLTHGQAQLIGNNYGNFHEIRNAIEKKIENMCLVQKNKESVCLHDTDTDSKHKFVNKECVMNSTFKIPTVEQESFAFDVSDISEKKVGFSPSVTFTKPVIPSSDEKNTCNKKTVSSSKTLRDLNLSREHMKMKFKNNKVDSEKQCSSGRNRPRDNCKSIKEQISKPHPHHEKQLSDREKSMNLSSASSLETLNSFESSDM